MHRNVFLFGQTLFIFAGTPQTGKKKVIDQVAYVLGEREKKEHESFLRIPVHTTNRKYASNNAFAVVQDADFSLLKHTEQLIEYSQKTVSHYGLSKQHVQQAAAKGHPFVLVGFESACILKKQLPNDSVFIYLTGPKCPHVPTEADIVIKRTGDEDGDVQAIIAAMLTKVGSAVAA